jgi:hypothetical protein
VPRDVEHDARADSHSRELHERLLELLGLVLTSLEQLGDHGDGADVQEGARGKGEQHITPCLIAQVSLISLISLVAPKQAGTHEAYADADADAE